MTEYKIAKMSEGERRFVDWLINEKGADPQKIDVDPYGVKKEISFEEAATFALMSSKWHEYVPKLDELAPGFPHPLDMRNATPEIRERIRNLALKAMDEVEIPPEDAGYCNAVLARFDELGAGTFADGGICFAYSESESGGIEDAEMTAVEVMSACQKDEKQLGTCTEKTYIKVAAVELAGLPCKLDTMDTEFHVYPEHNGISYDSSKVGPIGWKRKTNPVAIYYASIAAKTGDSTALKIASLADPDSIPDYSEYNKLIRKDRFEEALAVLDRVISKNKKSPKIFIDLQVTMRGLNTPRKAKLLVEIIKKWPDNPYLSLPIMATLSISDRVTKAVAVLLHREFPDSGLGEMIDAFILSGRGKASETEEMLIKSARLNENNAQAYQWLALSYRAKGDYGRARKTLKKAMEIAPNLPNNHYTLGQIYRREGNVDAAFEEAKKEAMICYVNPNARLLFAELLVQTGWLGNAISNLKELIPTMTGSGNISRAYMELINAYIQAGMNDAARRTYEEAKKLVGESETISQALYIELWDRQYDKVEELFENIPEKFKDRMFVKNWKFELALARGRISDAGDILDDIEKLSSNTGYYKGLLALAEGRLLKARIIFSRLSGRNKYEVPFHSMKVKCDIIRGKVERAERDLHKLTKDFPEAFEVRKLLPLYHLRKGDNARALLAAKKLLAINPDDMDLLVIKGFAMLGDGVPDGAIKTGKNLAANFPHSMAGNILLARAHMAKGEFKKARMFAERAMEQKTDAAILWPLVEPETVLAEITDRCS